MESEREGEACDSRVSGVSGLSISDIQRQVGVSRPSIYKCVDKALSAGVAVGLKDSFHRPKERRRGHGLLNQSIEEFSTAAGLASV